MCICESNGRVLVIFPVILQTVINGVFQDSVVWHIAQTHTGRASCCVIFYSQAAQSIADNGEGCHSELVESRGRRGVRR